MPQNQQHDLWPQRRLRSVWEFWKWRENLDLNSYLVHGKKAGNLGSPLSSSLCKVFGELMRSHWGVTEESLGRHDESLRRAWGGMRSHLGGFEVAMSSSFVFQHLRLWVKRVSHVGGPPYPVGPVGWRHIRSYGKSPQILIIYLYISGRLSRKMAGKCKPQHLPCPWKKWRENVDQLYPHRYVRYLRR